MTHEEIRALDDDSINNLLYVLTKPEYSGQPLYTKDLNAIAEAEKTMTLTEGACNDCRLSR